MMTHHASVRLQQRAIPPLLIDLLLQFGATEKAPGGVNKVFFDKNARRRVQSYAGSLASLLEQHMDVYAVVGDNEQVITVGHRRERICRH